MDNGPYILPAGTVLTVVIRDDSPMIHMNEPCRFRTVQVELTEEQRTKLALQSTGQYHGRPMHEDISACFIEESKEDNDD